MTRRVAVGVWERRSTGLFRQVRVARRFWERDYLEKLVPKIRPGGLILAHNMRSPPPNPDYVEAITTNADFETTFLLMEGSGIGVTLIKR